MGVSAANARLRRQKTTPTAASAPAPSTRGMTQMIGMPPVSGGSSKIVWPYSDTNTWSIWAADRPSATNCSIWRRAAMAVVALDWATERSVHEGQRTPASMEAAFCEAVGGAESNTPLPTPNATPSTTSGSATRTQRGSRRPRSATWGPLLCRPRRPGRGDGAVEVLLGGRADQRLGARALPGRPRTRWEVRSPRSARRWFLPDRRRPATDHRSAGESGARSRGCRGTRR